MSAALKDETPEQEGLAPFLSALVASGFLGEVATDDAARTVYATDNSIYQVRPRAILFPRDGADINRILRLADRFVVAVSPRGGGTGTNGQSLTRGVVIDTSRFLKAIHHLDIERGLVTVDPGVVLNQLNDFLKPHGLFFPPNVSTASRATIGGMVATDASGKGSRIYGKTSDYIEAMDVVLADGSDMRVERLTREGLVPVLEQADRTGAIHREVQRVVTEKTALISETFPKMNRGLTGYNLEHVTDEDGGFRLSYLLAGSEGTLAVTKALTLRVIPRPTHRALAAIRYADFQAALVDVRRLLQAEPAAVEIIDDKILSLARDDVLWSSIEGVLGGPTPVPVGGLNFVEFVGMSAEEVSTQVARLEKLLKQGDVATLGWTLVTDTPTINQLWSLREKSVGLLGRLGGHRPGIPFVEDTAVPPEKLADYVAEFRALLDSHSLSYGMFGHADVGCLHVRPALDMKDPADAALIRPISDGVASLTRKYGGLLWGEHGRGYRGEYSPFFFGPELYEELCRIKAVFDPKNLLNPGKLATTAKGAIDRIDAVPLRGEFDRQIGKQFSADFGKALACNGNGACFNWDTADPMCPSFKATGDRTQSPKGRAALIREWARLETNGPSAALTRIEGQLRQSLSTCLSCKACAGQCPIKVDIPVMKARFLDRYYRKYNRPLRDYLVASMEVFLPLLRRLPRLGNAVLKSAFPRWFGLVDLPALSHRTRRRSLQELHGKPDRAVILMEDSFTGSFDDAAVQGVYDLLELLGYRVFCAAPKANGKNLHVLGFLGRFAPIAKAARDQLAELNATGLPVIGVEAVTGLMFEHEYIQDGEAASGRLWSLEQFLAAEIAAGRIAPVDLSQKSDYRLLLHCTEKTSRPQTATLWTKIFAHFGLGVETPATGCCGMAGLFGHEREHKDLSLRLFELSWRQQISQQPPEKILATGFSCRCQTERFADFRPRHPAEALFDQLTNGKTP
ncbi:FAD-binding and (Fe-S)-binding domain-containing protein [Lacibacterium aquatile]|uniref:FAD-binding and (Fe-S)-binding domain-containing protein n=1 Tax=Lacibacterium aquatile TaxID=1168082 RepID=A0ABW5DQ74_9PROT